MKKLLLIISLFAAATAHGQDFDKMRREQRVKDSLAQITAGNSFNPNHSERTYLTNFIGLDYNKVMPGLQNYLQDRMGMASVDVMSGMDHGWLKIAYTPQVSESKVQRIIYVMAKMDNKGLIQQMKLTGDWELLVRLFCSYWPTKLNFNNVSKSELVSVYNIDEKITLSTAYPVSLITISKIKK